MGLDMELPLLLALGFVVFGPKRMQTIEIILRTQNAFRNFLNSPKSKKQTMKRTTELFFPMELSSTSMRSDILSSMRKATS